MWYFERTKEKTIKMDTLGTNSIKIQRVLVAIHTRLKNIYLELKDRQLTLKEKNRKLYFEVYRT